MSFIGLIAGETKGPKQSCPQSQSIQQGNECVQVSAVNIRCGETGPPVCGHGDPIHEDDFSF